MNKFSRLWQYLTEFCLEWEIFQINIVEKIKIHIIWSITFFRQLCRLWDIVEEQCEHSEAADGNMAARSMRISKAKRAQTHTRARATTPTHPPTHRRTHLC
jgi:hypothetical protein